MRDLRDTPDTDRITAPRRALAAWLAGPIGLDAALSMAERLAWEVSEPSGRPPTLVLHELEPSITIGRAGSRADVDITDEELRGQRLPLKFVGRGGGAVVHGPGQVCVSLFATLADLGLDRHDVGGYLERLEHALEAAVRTVRCGAARDSSLPGIFGRTGLLAAVGVAVRRGGVARGIFERLPRASAPSPRTLAACRRQGGNAYDGIDRGRRPTAREASRRAVGARATDDRCLRISAGSRAGWFSGACRHRAAISRDDQTCRIAQPACRSRCRS
jgi:lipoate-protein ligase B